MTNDFRAAPYDAPIRPRAKSLNRDHPLGFAFNGYGYHLCAWSRAR